MSRKSRSISMTLAAMAAALTVGATTVEAANKGLSAKQVKAIVKAEVAKIRQVTGPRGPAGAQGVPGPAGPAGVTGPAGVAGVDGLQFLFAHVSRGGVVDSPGGGITQANLDQIDVDAELEPVRTIYWDFCFTGLPPLVGGQVTLDGILGGTGVASASLNLGTGNPDCTPLVTVSMSVDSDSPPGFHLLLY